MANWVFPGSINYSRRYYYTISSSMESNRNNGKNNANQKEAKNSPISDFQEKEVNFHISNQLVINECAYYVHPIYI